jgi:hypothetical protein
MNEYQAEEQAALERELESAGRSRYPGGTSVRADEERKERSRLTLYLHSIQKHPDFEYCMTFEGSNAHKSLESWERNPALLNAWHGQPGQDAWRQQHSPRSSRELYWMRAARS